MKVIKMDKKKLRIVLEVLSKVSIAYPETEKYKEEIVSWKGTLFWCLSLLMMVAHVFDVCMSLTGKLLSSESFVMVYMMMIRRVDEPVSSYPKYIKYRFSLKNDYTQSHK